MSKIAIAIIGLATLAALAQSAPEPQLSTAEKTAIQSLETQKKAAQESFMQAQQAEVTIEREFAQAHAGYHMNPMSLAVEKDPKPPTPEKK